MVGGAEPAGDYSIEDADADAEFEEEDEEPNPEDLIDDLVSDLPRGYLIRIRLLPAAQLRGAAGHASKIEKERVRFMEFNALIQSRSVLPPLGSESVPGATAR